MQNYRITYNVQNIKMYRANDGIGGWISGSLAAARRVSVRRFFVFQQYCSCTDVVFCCSANPGAVRNFPASSNTGLRWWHSRRW